MWKLLCSLFKPIIPCEVRTDKFTEFRYPSHAIIGSADKKCAKRSTHFYVAIHYTKNAPYTKYVATCLKHKQRYTDSGLSHDYTSGYDPVSREDYLIGMVMES